MPETITRISLDELTTVRVKTEDGVIGEMPLNSLSTFARDQRQIRQLSKEAEAILGNLHAALTAAQDALPGRIEFVVTAD